MKSQNLSIAWALWFLFFSFWLLSLKWQGFMGLLMWFFLKGSVHEYISEFHKIIVNMVASMVRLMVGIPKWTDLKVDLIQKSFHHCSYWCLRDIKTYLPNLNGPPVFRRWWLSNISMQINEKANFIYLS